MVARMAGTNPLLDDRFIDFLLYDVLDATALCRLPAFTEHSKETFDPWIAACRRIAREVLYPAYQAMDAEPARLEKGRVHVHPKMRGLWRELTELGVIAANRPFAVGGQQLPMTVFTLATAYLMAGNLSAYGFAGLTTGAAHLIETFGSAAVRDAFLAKMYAGEWTGTMALTEPQAGSSLADVKSRARPAPEGHHLISGAKIFISGGDQDLTENIVHLVLARIDGAPAGTRGISLFAVPRLRVGPSGLVPNDVQTSGLIHKIGWRGIPSVALAFGEENDCHGFLIGAPNQGLKCMFQMMNEARIMIGANATATASVAFQESLAYAVDRKQGRAAGADASSEPVPLVAHADVRRMLLRQKAIVEGALCLIATTARCADLSEHALQPEERERQRLLLDLLTPIAKSFPAEKGFEANALALQIHGGYGYSSEYRPEAWLRDQKLNSIHEGTTGIQSLDLVGRKIVAGGGAALLVLQEEVLADVARAEAKGLDGKAMREALERVVTLTATLGARGAAGDLDGMLGHSTDFLELTSLLIVGWMWTRMAAAAAGRTDDFAQGIHAAARYWHITELPRIPALAALCDSAERSYLDVKPGWLGA
jgi:alkylation response protein AidB-like acyl-CoA dehydrogenase